VLRSGLRKVTKEEDGGSTPSVVGNCTLILKCTRERPLGGRGPAGEDRRSNPSGEDGRTSPSGEGGRNIPRMVDGGTMGPGWGGGGSLGEDAPTEAPTEGLGPVDGGGSKPCPDADVWPAIKQKLKVNKQTSTGD